MSDIQELDEGGGLADDQAAELAALQAAAVGGEVQPGTPAETEPEPQRLPLNQELSGMLSMLSKVIAPMLPTVAKIYSDETCEAIGAAVAPVCEKYGWLQDGIGGKYGEEIMALVVVGPIAYATVTAARADLAARQPKEPARLEDAAAAPGAYQQPGADTVIIGAPAT